MNQKQTHIHAYTPARRTKAEGLWHQTQKAALIFQGCNLGYIYAHTLILLPKNSYQQMVAQTYP